jgi:DNA-binding CsgD family transcriptional regulator/tetratricopeptide (TPR) repeat protein
VHALDLRTDDLDGDTGVSRATQTRHDEAMVGRPPAALVGRDDSLGVLKAAVRRASAGHPSVLLISGETGVGKTRLVRELIEQERVTLLHGACVPMAGDPLPFAPLTQALRRLDRTGTLNLQLERSPELARLVPGKAPAMETRTVDLAAASQLGLFQSVLDLVDRLGAAAPVLHVVEDVHWADRSTLDLVRFLATNFTTERAVLVVTLRADAVVPGTPLALWVAELARLEIAERVQLDRLDHDSAARLVRALAGEAADPEFVETTLARSAGNPLFAEQLVLQAKQDPDALPATLHELLHARVNALPAETQSVLRSAAVIGRPAAVTLLAATIGMPVEDTEALLRPALDQHVVELRRDDTIAFRHPAFGEVVYAELMPNERRRLHRAAAVALQPPEGFGTGQCASVAADAVSGELARHWFGAGDRQLALNAAVAAGWAAERMYAFADAYTNFTRAVALIDEVPDAGQDRVRLLKHAGQAASLLGDSTEAVRLVEAALHLTTDPPARAAMLTRLGLIHYRAGRGSMTEGYLREALTLLPPNEESPLMARIHAGLALFGAAWSRLDVAEESCRRGLEVARKVGARREEGLLLNASGLVETAHGDIDGGARLLREALAIAAEIGNPDDLATAYANLSHVLGLGGRVDEIVDVVAEGAEVLTRMGLARQRVSFLKANLAEALGNAGRFRESGQVTAEALSHHPRGIMSVPVLIQAGRVAVVGGDLDEAWEWLEQGRVVVESENAPESYRRSLVEIEAEVELWAGRPLAAYELVVDGLGGVRGTDEEAYAGILIALGLRALATEAEAHRDHDSRKRLADLRRPLDLARAWPPANQPDDAAVRAWQRAEATRLELASDPVAWAETAAAWEALNRPFPRAYARWREAEARLDSGVDAAAIDALRDAHISAVSLGAARLVQECERLAGWHRIDLAPAEVAAEPGALDKYGLTPREVEVLQGLSAGRTNQEIADQLFISVKTASVHVSNILRKLDVGGRQEAARVAHRLGV